MAPRKRTNGGPKTQTAGKPTIQGVFVSKRGIEFEEDFVAPPEKGRIYGRCGGRPIMSELEQKVCQSLSREGIAHSHAPRRFEVRFDGDKVGAYSPTMVIRGRGREGKTMVLECLPESNPSQVSKIKAFRELYNLEFYVILIAPGAVMDELPPGVADEELLPSEVEILVARVAE
ncbi:MAG: hypothetical protein R3F30_01035 [Planctomycetota bacterium]